MHVQVPVYALRGCCIRTQHPECPPPATHRLGLAPMSKPSQPPAASRGRIGVLFVGVPTSTADAYVASIQFGAARYSPAYDCREETFSRAATTPPLYHPAADSRASPRRGRGCSVAAGRQYPHSVTRSRRETLGRFKTARDTTLYDLTAPRLMRPRHSCSPALRAWMYVLPR